MIIVAENTNLASQKCEACSIGTIPLSGGELFDIMQAINENWKLKENKQIERSFKFKDFATALEFVNKVGQIAEDEGHHPDIELGWGRAKIKLTTHKIHGLSTNDFIMAAKIDELA